MSKTEEFICADCGKPIDINKQGLRFGSDADGNPKFQHHESNCEVKRDVFGEPLVNVTTAS